jgi:hypothetical protein
MMQFDQFTSRFHRAEDIPEDFIAPARYRHGLTKPILSCRPFSASWGNGGTAGGLVG